METASIQYINTTVNNRLHNSYNLEISKLTNVNTYIMKKLTNVSPFILLLIPVFVMMIFALTNGKDMNQRDGLAMKSAPAAEIAKTAYYQVK
ncbi:hypothetical protein TH53_03045 [Pedobacter lusitanus]|uniref:Uncharacterized protein n=1 Tax=Pedobacter lusitanus TaxID=1503925 RepID=A0A0D0GQT8_9SPHI|nr:hypothetical protein [Pedobacter lusitanus]KIO78565.1 hypothetical protein TH53_03045 [Pedobacter lusitanus]